VSQLAQVIVSGLSVGAIYGLIGIGFSLSYRTTRVINVALGDLSALGAYFAWWLYTVHHVGLPIVVVVAPVAVGIVMVVVERVALRPLYGRGMIYPVLATIGLSAVIVSVIQLLWGSETQTMKPIFRQTPVDVLGVAVVPESVWILVVGVAVAAAVILFLRYSKVGTAMRATAQDARSSSLLGVPVGWMYSSAYFLTGVIAGLAGLLVAPVIYLQPTMGLGLTLSAFVAAIIGGYGSVGGAMVGGLLLGLINALTGYFLDPKLLGLTSYAVLLLVLLIRPTGIFGEEGRARGAQAVRP
jgi:branched-chain amino acid transport system permease protein